MVAVAEAPVIDEAERLSGYSFADLKAIAEEIGATPGRSKKALVANILAKRAGEQAPDELETAGEAPGAPSVPQEGVEGGALSATEVEADAQADAAREEGAEEKAPLLPVKHLMVTMHAAPDESIGVLDQAGVNARVDELLVAGYEPIEFATLGFSPGGHKLFYVFEQVKKPRYTRSMHIMKLLTPQPNPIRNTITGFQADAYISAFIEQGWKLVGARYNGDDVMGEVMNGIYIIWMLVK